VIGGAYACDMYVWLCAFAWLYIWFIGILYAKAFSGFSMDLSSSIQLESVGFINSGGDCWHKEAWSKEMIKPCTWRSYVFDEDWWKSIWRLCFSVLNMKITC